VEGRNEEQERMVIMSKSKYITDDTYEYYRDQPESVKQENRDTAVRHFGRGNFLMAQEDYDGAIDAFTSAYSMASASDDGELHEACYRALTGAYSERDHFPNPFFDRY